MLEVVVDMASRVVMVSITRAGADYISKTLIFNQSVSLKKCLHIVVLNIEIYQ